MKPTLFSLGLVLLLGVAQSLFAQKIVIKGSNTFGEELGPRLIETYRGKHPGIAIELESKGSGTGFAALLAGECDIAASSRVINEDELRLARSRGVRVHSHTIGYYGVAVIVNAENKLQNLSDMQVRSLFTGIIHRWDALGGGQQPVQTYIRDAISGTYLGFQELAMDRMPYAKSAKPLKSYREIADAVKADPHGIGYVGMNLGIGPGVRAVRINEIPITIETVNNETYPYARQLRLYTDARRESAGARAFIRYVQSREGQNVLEEMGYVKRFGKGSLQPPSVY